MCGSMVDIRSATAEIMQGKKKKKIEETTKWKYNGQPYSVGKGKEGPIGHLVIVLQQHKVIPLITNQKLHSGHTI